MDLRRVFRLASVLVASQLRSGRSSSEPNDFFGRPLAIVVADAILFFSVFLLAFILARALAPTDPAFFAALVPQALAFLPLLSLGVVVLAGVMFELSASAKFTASDAANWMPITPTEFVLASSLGATFVYSLTAALILGFGAGLTVVSGAYGLFGLAFGLTVLAVFEGGILIEMLRSSTQRLTAVIAGRTGRATLALRIVLFFCLILALQVAVNPIILLALLQDLSQLGWVAFLLPPVWPSRAVLSLSAGDLGTAGALTAAALVLCSLLLLAAARLRVRFWSPAAVELEFSAHAYGERHTILGSLGLSAPESALVAKDLKGLVRRRELLPILLVPVVIVAASLVPTLTSERGSTGPFALGLIAAWVPGFFALLLSATCIGQERRAIQNLYALPIAWQSVFRAKVVSIALPSTLFGVAIWIAVSALSRPPLGAALALLGVVGWVLPIGTFLGLAFASRYSDFQERPRPQFLRPAAMIGAMMLGLLTIMGTAIPALFWVYSGTPITRWAEYAAPLAVGLLTAALAFVSSRRGTDQLWRSLPV